MKILLQLRELHKAFGDRVLLDKATVAFAEEQRVGCVGRNGAGKTTLLRLITGEDQADSGEIQKATDLHMAYLEQQDPFRPDETVLDFMVRQSGREGWRCGKLAARFQLKGDILDTAVRQLSGGFQTRVKLAAMLAREPNFLLLDEPTNYLDLSTLMLLENFLEDFRGGFLIVSHDREFLKRTCDHTLEIENGRVGLFPGNVEAWLERKEEQKEIALAYNKNVEGKRKQLQLFVDRFGAKNTKASQAKSKMKQIARLKPIKIEHPMSTVRIRMPPVQERRGWALRCDDLAIGYPDRTVAQDIRLEVDAGERIAVLGDNGQGKTTFLRTLSGDLAPLGGGFRWAENLSVACFAQHVYTTMNPEQTARAYLESKAARDVTRQQIMDMAGSFLFGGDEVEKLIGVLSGGERARLCLAGMLLSRCNVLLLDEPTNHLDFETVEALGTALHGFQGTIFFTSHDRTFVSLAATAIVEVRGGSVVLRRQTYQDYVDRLEQEVEEDEGNGDATPVQTPPQSLYARRKELQARINKAKSRLSQVEKRVAELEAVKEALVQEFAQKPGEYSRERNIRMDRILRDLAKAEEEWLSLGQEKEVLDTEYRGLG